MGHHGAARRLALLASMMIACLAWGAPISAQVPIPYDYRDITAYEIPLAPLDKPAEQIARETAAADDVEAQCNRSVPAGCAALGRAFLYGEGRPQNRPVAELLLRQACNGAEASGCFALGQLLWSARMTEMRAEAQLAQGRGCMLGNLEACAEEANAIEAGTDIFKGGDKEAAMVLRQRACARGGKSACRDLGTRLLRSDDPTQREAGVGVLERNCRSGDGQSCGRVLDAVRQNAALAQAIADLGCDAGLPYLCRDAGDIGYAAAAGDPVGQDAALAKFDRACALEKMFCSIPAAIRAEPALRDACERAGVAADCFALGEIYARQDTPLYSPAKAGALLGAACENGTIDACGAAARVIEDSPIGKTPDNFANVVRWYDIGCRGGSDQDCRTLGTDLLQGEYTFSQRRHGYELLALACERGDLDSCNQFDEYALADPSAPLIPADARFVPIEMRDEKPQPEPEPEQQDSNSEDARCRSSEVEFRGVVYADKICLPPAAGVTFGRLALAGEAPWQALLWRPSFMAGRDLAAHERVECGGALIRHGWVLTAAHCVVDGNRNPIITKGYRIRLGTYFSQEDDGIEYEIRGIYVHPDYKLRLRIFDIALLQLELGRRTRRGSPRQIRSIEFDQIPVEQRAFPAGSPVRVFGWGHTTFQGRTSNELKVAELQLEAQDVCEKSTGTALKSKMQASLLCAKAADRSQACDADSGGPLVMYEKNRMNVQRPLLVGVVNAGKECGRRGDATRYTRVAKMAGWIRDVLAGKQQPLVPR